MNVRRSTDDFDIECLFKQAVADSPTLVVLEDLDSLTDESSSCRYSILNQLDGLRANEGILVIGTTNHPERIDPALMHRPSRFDRVWRFELPDAEVRVRYLQRSFGELPFVFLREVAESTAGWSFSYLNELRVGACMQAAQAGCEF